MQVFINHTIQKEYCFLCSFTTSEQVPFGQFLPLFFIVFYLPSLQSIVDFSMNFKEHKWNYDRLYAIKYFPNSVLNQLQILEAKQKKFR